MAKAGIYRWLAGGLTAAALAGFGCQGNKATTTGTPGQLPGTAMGTEATPRLNATTYFAHAHLLERQGDFDRARVQYEKALAVMPEFTSARNRLGITLNKLNKNAEATTQFRMILAKHPELAHVQNNLGFSLYLEGNHAEAETALRHALKINEGFSRARMNLAIVLAKQERFDEALAEFQKVGDQADAHYNLAMLQIEAGHYAQAAQNLEIALRANPKLEAARLQLHEVSRLAAGQPEPATKLQALRPQPEATLTAAQVPAPAIPSNTAVIEATTPTMQPSDPATDPIPPATDPGTGTPPGQPPVEPTNPTPGTTPTLPGTTPTNPGIAPTPSEPADPGSDDPLIVEPTDPKPEPSDPNNPGGTAMGRLLGEAVAAAHEVEQAGVIARETERVIAMK